ncbi:MAG: c-type cytochrome [Anaerolineae bacterium]
MRKVLKWSGIILGSLIGLVVILAVTLIIIGTSRLNKTYDIQPETVAIPTDETAVARGRYIFSSACAGCHGDNMAGTPFFDDPALGSIPAPNLTAGNGGIGSRYSSADFVRAIRHGVRPDGTPLMIMPSGAFYHFSDEDLGAIIAYVQHAAPQDQAWAAKNLSPMGRMLLVAGALGDALQAETIDHTGPRPTALEQGATAVYGEYLINTGDCRSCHGDTLTGQQPGEPGAPFAPDLTAAGHLSDWSADDFVAAMRTGKSPDGHDIDGAFMPWEHIGRLTNDDLTAMYLYLQSQPEEAVSSTE